MTDHTWVAAAQNVAAALYGFRPFCHIPDRHVRNVKNAAFFLYRATIGYHTTGTLLQSHKIEKTHRLEKSHIARLDFQTKALNFIGCSRVQTNDHDLPETRCHQFQPGHQL